MSDSPLDEEIIFKIAREIGLPEARAEYLRQACGDNLALLGRVGILLRVYDEERSFLESPPQGVVATPAIDQAITEKPGTQVGPYKLLQQIGEGGMGLVYMAEQTEPVERRVALKIIKPGMDTRQVIARFEAERHALAMMDHPHIARVVDAGTTETGQPYFVMELVKGVPITQYCDEHHLSPRERLELFVPVCHAVQHAHQKGIIHRDIKPGNVLVAEYDERPVPKIIDFGVAKAVEQRLAERSVLTQLGQVVGTIDYMSPEQAKLNQLDVDTRSDVYSLGVLMYELLTGETPFDRERLRAAAFDELLRIIREEEPPKPSTRLSSSQSLPSIAANRQIEPKKLSTLVRGELDWIVMKALEKDRGRRYETANRLATDVQHYLANEPVEAGPPSATYRFRKFARRNKALLAVTAIIAVVLLLASFVSTSMAIRATRAFRSEMQARGEAEEARGSAQRRADEATAARTDAERATAEAQAVADFLVNDLLGSAAPEKTLGRDLTVKEVLANAEKTIDAAFQGQPLREAAVRQTMSEVYGRLGLYELAERHARQAVELRTRLLSSENPETLTSVSNLAWVFKEQGKFDEARKLTEETLAIRKRVLGAEHPRTLGSINKLAIVLKHQGKLEEARQLYEEVVAIQKRVQGPEDPDTLATMHNLAVVLREQNELDKARKLDEEILTVRNRILGPEHPDTLKSMGNLACTVACQGKSDEARRLFEETLTIQKRVLGPEHASTLLSMNNLANSLRDLSMYDEARKVYVDTLAIQTHVLGPEHPDTLTSMHDLASVFWSQRKLDEARRLFDETLAIRKRVLGPEHPATLLSMHNLAVTLQDLGQTDEACDLLDEAHTIQKSVLGPRHPNTLLSMSNLALAIKELDRLDEAHRHSQVLLRELYQVAADNATEKPLQERVASCERGICWRYGAMGLWDLAATVARHNAALGRVTDYTRDADFAVLLAALGEVDAWREYCPLLIPQTGEESLGDQPGAPQICTVLLFDHTVIDPGECVVMARKVLDQDPRRYYYHFCLALAQYRASQYTEALETIESNPVNASWESIAAQESKPACAYLYALAAQGDGRKEDALAQLGLAESLYQDVCKSQLAEDREELTEPFCRWFWDLAAAQVLRREAWQEIQGQPLPADPWWHLIQARGYALLGESERAKQEFAAAVAADDPEIWLVWATRARVREQVGDIARAEADWNRSLELAPLELPEDDPRPWTERARLCARLGRYDEAAHDFIHANGLLRNPPRWDARSALFDSVMQHEEIFVRIAELRPDDRDLWHNKGKYHALRGQWELALPGYARASVDRQLNTHYAHVLLLSGDEEGYRRLCQRAATQFGQTDQPDTARELVLICSAGSHSGVDPAQILERAQFSLRPGRNKFRLQALAHACYRTGQFDETAKLLQEAMGLPDAMPKSEAAFPLALAYHGLGQGEEAAKWYQIGFAELESISPRDADRPVSWALWHWLNVNVWYREAKVVFEATEPKVLESPEPAVVENRDGQEGEER